MKLALELNGDGNKHVRITAEVFRFSRHGLGFNNDFRGTNTVEASPPIGIYESRMPLAVQLEECVTYMANVNQFERNKCQATIASLKELKSILARLHNLTREN